MNNLQKIGGIAVLGHAAVLVVGMVLSFTRAAYECCCSAWPLCERESYPVSDHLH